MYDYLVKQGKIIKNTTKHVSERTKFFNSKTKELIEKGHSRRNAREIIKSSLNPIGEIGPSEFSKSNLRKTRKDRAKRLKVPFRPSYNGPVFRQIWVEDEATGKLVPQFVK